MIQLTSKYFAVNTCFSWGAWRPVGREGIHGHWE